MLVLRKQPVTSLSTRKIDNFFDRLFNDEMIPSFWGYDNGFVSTRSYLDVNKTKDKDGILTLSLNVPGFNKENLSIKLINGYLEVSGTREDGLKTEFSEYVGQNSELNAKLKDGLLVVTIKEKKEEIQIKIE